MRLFRLAIRNLLRNRWRSGLAAGGIAVATAVLIWNTGFFDGYLRLMVEGSTDVEIGHVQVQHERYVEQPATIDYFEWDDDVEREIAQSPGVVAATPRVRLFGLIGHQQRSHVGTIYGVDPETESEVSTMVDGIEQGRWLSDEMPEEGPAEVVVGTGLAETLGVEVGDELVVIAEGADGSMGDGLLEIVGIMKTGNSAIDRRGALIHLDEAQYIAAVDEGVHEVVATIDDPVRAPMVADQLQNSLDRAGFQQLRARPWQEVEPGLFQMLSYTESSNRVIFGIIFFIVALGVLNALRMSARERYREFGVMMAVGMSRKRLFSMIATEGALLGVVGSVVGGAIGAALTWYYKVQGLDLAAYMNTEQDITYMGVSFTDVVYFSMTWETVLTPAIGLIAVTTICALWPALAAIRLEPRDAITGRV